LLNGKKIKLTLLQNLRKNLMKYQWRTLCLIELWIQVLKIWLAK
jgi:hypothetical protein